MIEYHPDLRQMLVDTHFDPKNISELERECDIELAAKYIDIDKIDSEAAAFPDELKKDEYDSDVGVIFTLPGLRRDGKCYMYCAFCTKERLVKFLNLKAFW